jgi:transposase
VLSGISCDGRPDCPQICIGVVASKEGLPLSFEIFDGNRTEVTTTQEMLQMMKSKYGKANRIWVMDRGMVSEDNLEYMRRKGARYLVGTPKFMLNKFERQLLEDDWEEVQSGVDVKVLPSRQDPSPYHGLFSCIDNVADFTTADESIGTRHCPQKTA